MIASAEEVVTVEGLEVVLRQERTRVRSLREYAVKSFERSPKQTVEWRTVLRGLSFSVRRGDLLAVVGENGAGKTTLLRVLAGIVPPSRGRVRIQGTLAPLIDLGGGFDPELTGRENAALFASLLAPSIAGAAPDFPGIAAFAGIESDMDLAVRSYSTGMIARLAFATATATRPDVLLVDEVLAVGDEAFRARCLQRIEDLRRAGTCVVLVSHDLSLVESLATTALYLAHGRMARAGAVGEVLAAYREAAAR